MKKRSVARLLLLSLVMLIAFMYMTSLACSCNVSHDCCGASCAICLVVSMREALAKLLFVPVLAFLAMLAQLCAAAPAAVRACCVHHTPILLKVKLSD